MFYFKKKCSSCEDLRGSLAEETGARVTVEKENTRLRAQMEILKESMRTLEASLSPSQKASRSKAVSLVDNQTSGSAVQNKGRRKQYRVVVLNAAVRDIVQTKTKAFLAILKLVDFDMAKVKEDTDLQDMLLAELKKHGAAVARKVGFQGDPETFGELIQNDERTLDRLLGELPILAKAALKQQQEDEIRQKRWEALTPVLQEAISENEAKLVRNLRMALKTNEYGSIEEDSRDIEVFRFLESVKLMPKARAAGLTKVTGFVKAWSTRRVKGMAQKAVLPNDGIDFEYWVADRLRQQAWMANVTQGSGDQGVDVIAERSDVRVAVQCKLYQGSVGNKAVQEALAGMHFFDLDRAAIVSTGTYTRSAKQLATKNNILLLEPDDIPLLYDLLMS